MPAPAGSACRCCRCRSPLWPIYVYIYRSFRVFPAPQGPTGRSTDRRPDDIKKWRYKKVCREHSTLCGGADASSGRPWSFPFVRHIVRSCCLLAGQGRARHGAVLFTRWYRNSRRKKRRVSPTHKKTPSRRRKATKRRPHPKKANSKMRPHSPTRSTRLALGSTRSGSRLTRLALAWARAGRGAGGRRTR